LALSIGQHPSLLSNVCSSTVARAADNVKGREKENDGYWTGGYNPSRALVAELVDAQG
jgi:hypothetical protein